MDSKERIFLAAREEFLEKGFLSASMRSIANKVGITATALYRHYADKESLFDAVVAPAVKVWEDYVEYEKNRQYTQMTQEGADAMWESGDETSAGFIEMLYQDFDTNRLLLCGSKGTKYENFLHDQITKIQIYTIEFMEFQRAHGAPVKEINEKEMHLLLSAQYSAIFEMLDHEFTKEEALHYAQVISRFFSLGWRDYLGF